MTTKRSTRLPVPKSEMYFMDETTGQLKPLVGTNGSLGVNISNADIAIPVDVQYVAIKAELKVLLQDRQVRNATRNWLITGQDWSAYKNSVLRVSNTHNQPIKLEFHIQDIGIMTKVDGTPYTITIPAYAENVIVNATAMPILGEAIADKIAIAFISAVAPTEGTVSVVASFTPLI